MTSLFVSYSRKDTAFAHKLTEAFEDQDWDFWIDWEDIPATTDWRQQIEKGIEQTGVFLFLLSPDSVKSDVCRWEIAQAVKNGKRLIPIVVRDVRADEVPSALGSLNWILCRENDDFQIAFGKLTTAIKTDYDWVETHQQLQIKALEWERSGHENSFLLRGKELQDAEIQLATNSSREPYPTELQREYTLRSRQAADKQRKIVIGITIVAGIALASLAVFGWVQAGRATTNAQAAQTQEAFAQIQSTKAFNNAETAQANAEEAQREARLARAREISTWAQTVAQPYTVDQPLLALTALQVLHPGDPTVPAAERTLRDITGLHHPPLIGHADEVDNQLDSATGVSSDGHWFATAYSDGIIDIWQFLDSQGSLPEEIPAPPVELSVQDSGIQETALVSLASSSPKINGPLLSLHGKWIVVAYNYNSILLWNLQNPNQKPYLLQGKPAIDSVGTMAFSPDENWLAITDRTFEKVFLFNLQSPDASGLELGRVCPDLLCISAAKLYFFEKSTKLLAVADTGTAHLWDLENLQAGEKVFTKGQLSDACSSDQRCLLINAAGIHSVEGVLDVLAISPDNHWLVGRTNLNRFGLWNTAQPASEPIILPNIVNATFGADGSWLMLLEPDRFFDLWYVDEKKLVQVACMIAGRNFTLEEWVSYFGSEPYQANCPEFPSAPPQPTPTGGIPSPLALPTLELTPSPTQ